MPLLKNRMPLRPLMPPPRLPSPALMRMRPPTMARSWTSFFRASTPSLGAWMSGRPPSALPRAPVRGSIPPRAAADKDDGDGEDPDKPRKLGADSVVADSVKMRMDAEEIEAYKAETGSQHARADSVLADIQSRADRASSAWGKSARPPMDGERIGLYRRRVAREHQQYSPAWKDVDLDQLSGQSLRNAASQIFADSIAASTSPDS